MRCEDPSRSEDIRDLQECMSGDSISQSSICVPPLTELFFGCFKVRKSLQLMLRLPQLLEDTQDEPITAIRKSNRLCDLFIEGRAIQACIHSCFLKPKILNIAKQRAVDCKSFSP